MIQVTAAVIKNNLGEYLVCQRPADKNCALLWEFPGGKIEPDETPQACLARECLEELSIEIAVGAQLAQVCHAYPAIAVCVTFYAAAIASGTPVAREHLALRWAAPSAFDTVDFCPADRAALPQLLRCENLIEPLSTGEFKYDDV